MPKKTFYFGTRRDFLKSTSLALGAATVSAPYFLRAQGANERINVACIGVGGKGDSDSSSAYRLGGNIVAVSAGTTIITATFEGLVDWFWLSTLPR